MEQCKWKGTDHRSILYRTLFAHFGKQPSGCDKPDFLIKGTPEYSKFLGIVEVLTPLFGGNPYTGKGESGLEDGPLEMQVEFAFKPLPRNINDVSDSTVQSYIPNKVAAYEAGLISASSFVEAIKIEELV